MPNGECHQGSANKAAIEALTGWQKRQDDAMDKLSKRLDTLNTKADVQRDNTSRILGGVVVACILLVVNILITWLSNGGA